MQLIRFAVLALVLVLGCPKADEVDDVAPPVEDVPDVAEEPDIPDEPDEGDDPDPGPTPEVDEPDEGDDPDEGPPPECTTGDDCKDFDNCTEDVCTEEGTCENPPIVGCCTDDSECDDGIACTIDECNSIQGKCLHTFQDNTCCFTAEDCIDSDPCTLDLCASNTCVHPQLPSDQCTCVSDVLCDDGNPCTADKCKAGSCEYAFGQDGDQCCTSVTDCDDGDDTTYDSCQQGLCWHGKGACATAEDCVAPSACVKASCDDGQCVFAEPPDCCVVDGECDDGHDVTDDACVESQCVHTIGSPTACTSDTNCFQPNPCTTSSCKMEAGLCSFEPTFGGDCCTQDADCPAPPDECSISACTVFQCAVTPLDPALKIVWSSDFDDGMLQGWTVDTDGKNAKWQVDSAQAISPPNALYYGQLPDMNYNVGATFGSVTSPEIIAEPTDTVVLFFQRNADIEPISSRDLLWLEVVQGSDATQIWDKGYEGGPGLGWKAVTLDISDVVSGPFQLRFQFDSVDDIGNFGAGVYVDDVRIQMPCD